MARTEPAAGVWAGPIAAALGWDVWLVRNGHRSLSQVARCPAGWLLHAVLVAHFAHVLGRYDPFHYCANRLTPRRTT